MAVLQIAILFGSGSHFVTLYFGVSGWSEGEGEVISRQRVGSLKAFFLCPEPSIWLEEDLCSAVLRHIAMCSLCSAVLRHIAMCTLCSAVLRHIAMCTLCSAVLRHIATCTLCSAVLRHIAMCILSLPVIVLRS